MNSANRQGGDANIIRRAFLRSLAAIALLALIIVALLWWVRREQPAPVLPDSVEPVAPLSAADPSGRQVPPVVFTDITKSAGITFVHTNGAYGEKLMPEAIGSGLAFLDYDNDADQDLLLVNSDRFPGQAGDGEPLPALYRNDGSGHFTDVTGAAGLAYRSYGMGVACGDYDNDGWTDLYITALGKNRLLRNEQGRFIDVTDTAGVAGTGQDWSTAAAFLDVDLDGDLDLFVGNYVEWTRETDLEIDFRVTGLGRAIGAPNHFYGTTNRLYRNEGDGRFTDVSQDSGIIFTGSDGSHETGKALAVVPVDYDRDGLPDLFVANDTTRNFLYHNLGDGRFEEIGVLEGVAYDRNGKSTGAMGTDAAWFRNDGELGIGVGNFANEMSSLFVTADGNAPFIDEAILEGLGAPTRLALTFGLFFFDYDLDGLLDLFQANGHLEEEINRVQPAQTYAQPAQLFWNCGEHCRSRFRLVGAAGDLGQPLVGRGAAYADIDADGDLDIAVLQNGRAAVLLRNDQRSDHHWLRVVLEGRTANRSAIGAEIELEAGGSVQRRQVMPVRSYLSSVELPVTFGLGTHDRVTAMRVRWPGGGVQPVDVGPVDTTLHIVQETAP